MTMNYKAIRENERQNIATWLEQNVLWFDIERFRREFNLDAKHLLSYAPTWDLTTIPDDLLHAEAARRRALKRSYPLKHSSSEIVNEYRRKKREQMRKWRSKGQ